MQCCTLAASKRLSKIKEPQRIGGNFFQMRRLVPMGTEAEAKGKLVCTKEKRYLMCLIDVVSSLTFSHLCETTAAGGKTCGHFGSKAFLTSPDTTFSTPRNG